MHKKSLLSNGANEWTITGTRTLNSIPSFAQDFNDTLWRIYDDESIYTLLPYRRRHLILFWLYILKRDIKLYVLYMHALLHLEYNINSNVHRIFHRTVVTLFRYSTKIIYKNIEGIITNKWHLNVLWWWTCHGNNFVNEYLYIYISFTKYIRAYFQINKYWV